MREGSGGGTDRDTKRSKASDRETHNKRDMETETDREKD